MASSKGNCCSSGCPVTGAAAIVGAAVLGGAVLYKLFGHKCSPTKSVVATDKAPAAIGPYSQAIKTSNGFVFVSGCIGFSPAGKMVEGDVSDQARQALTNMKAILEEAGSSMEKVSKVTVLLTDMAVFSQVNAVYKTFFSADPKPARACFAVKALPAGALVEIEAIALQ